MKTCTKPTQMKNYYIDEECMNCGDYESESHVTDVYEISEKVSGGS